MLRGSRRLRLRASCSLAVLDAERDRIYYQEVDLIITRERIAHGPQDAAGRGAVRPRDGARDLLGTSGTSRRDDRVPPDRRRSRSATSTCSTAWTTRSTSSRSNLDGRGRSSEYRRRLSELRHDLLRVRRTLAPTRDAVRGVVDGRVDIDDGVFRREIFPEEVERAFAGVLDKLLRATESLELSRDLLAAVRDYQRHEIANEQNEIIKRLTVIASLLLFPTFIVGVYGQNFDHMPGARAGTSATSSPGR